MLKILQDLFSYAASRTLPDLSEASFELRSRCRQELVDTFVRLVNDPTTTWKDISDRRSKIVTFEHTEETEKGPLFYSLERRQDFGPKEYTAIIYNGKHKQEGQLHPKLAQMLFAEVQKQNE